ncbi:hypothetical protein SK128_023386 [Halocaridina rubra]|uniref:Uncharacterized protein n=1 Tax=Halocaridina rubra TaxID=373956 RepID=A0AAN8WFZ3_HALRR
MIMEIEEVGEKTNIIKAEYIRKVFVSVETRDHISTISTEKEFLKHTRDGLSKLVLEVLENLLLSAIYLFYWQITFSRNSEYILNTRLFVWAPILLNSPSDFVVAKASSSSEPRATHLFDQNYPKQLIIFLLEMSNSLVTPNSRVALGIQKEEVAVESETAPLPDQN